ncbi:MAG: hypothetical protein U0401_00785 [Anaerolineae bacterium]
MSARNLATLLLGSIGLLFLLVGVGLLGWGRSQAQAIEQASSGPMVRSAAELSQSSPGAVIMLEGKIAERNPLLERELVAYVSSQYRGERCLTPTPDNDNFDDPPQCQSIWVEANRETPPLWLDLSGGRVQLANSDYGLQHPSMIWESTEELIKDETLRYAGFKINDPVFIRGTLTGGAAGPTLKADFVFGGDSEAYFEAQRSSNSVLFLLGAIFSVVGAVCVFIGGTSWWTGRK